MKTMNKKGLKLKYNLYVNRLLLNTKDYKKYLSEEDIKTIKKIDILITKLLKKTLLQEVKEELKSAKK